MEKVVSKKVVKSFEAGSGALYIPILGDLFPKLWGQKMKGSNKYFIFTEKFKYEVNEEDYNKLNEGDVFDNKMSLFQ